MRLDFSTNADDGIEIHGKHVGAGQLDRIYRSSRYVQQTLLAAYI